MAAAIATAEVSEPPRGGRPGESVRFGRGEGGRVGRQRAGEGGPKLFGRPIRQRVPKPGRKRVARVVGAHQPLAHGQRLQGRGGDDVGGGRVDEGAVGF